MSTKKPIPVVAAVLCHNGLFLAAQRPAAKHLGLKWEFPGGKVEAGEKVEEALKREIREELGCEITLTKALPSFVHHYESVSIEMFPFLAELSPGSPEPHAHEHEALQWITKEDFHSLDWAEADLPILEELR